MNRWRPALLVAKLAVGISLIVILLAKIDTHRLQESVQSADVRLLFAAVGAFLVASVFEVLKFRAACQFRIDIPVAARLVLSGLFFNNFLPSNIGGDGYKLWRLRDWNIGTAAAVTYLLSDRATGMLALVVLGATSLLVSLQAREMLLVPGQFGRLADISDGLLWVTLVIVVVLVAVAALIMKRFRNQLPIYLQRARGAAGTYLQVSALPTILYALSFHLARGTGTVLVCYSLGEQVGLFPVLLVLAIVALAAMLPISVGGLGVREGVTALLLTTAGVSSEVAITAALFNLAVLWFKSLCGAALFLQDRSRNNEKESNARIQGGK